MISSRRSVSFSCESRTEETSDGGEGGGGDGGGGVGGGDDGGWLEKSY